MSANAQGLGGTPVPASYTRRVCSVSANRGQKKSTCEGAWAIAAHTSKTRHTPSANSQVERVISWPGKRDRACRHCIHMTPEASTVLTAVTVITIVLLAARLICASPSDLVGFWSTQSGDLLAVRLNKAGLEVWTAPTRSTESGPRAQVHQLWCRFFVSEAGGVKDYGRLSLNGRRVVWRRGATWFRQGVN